jgi:hypothetical protein
MKKKDIISAIVKRVESSRTVEYSTWRIGLTHDPDERKQEHRNKGRNTDFWQQWRADSLSDAEQVETHFISEKGMEGGTGGELDARKTVYVYIF